MAPIRRAFKKASALVMPVIHFRSSLFHIKRRRAHTAPRPLPWPIHLLSSLLSLTLLVTTCTLPIPVAFLLVSADAAAVTEGCETKTCCTALCYVDENGVHHCVHKHSDACERGSSSDEPDVNPVLLTTLATASDSEDLTPSLDPIGWIIQ